MKFGPDGRLYTSDWADGWPKSKRGRIYAISDPQHEKDPIVQETRLHYPTVVSLFGAYLELPSAHRHFEEDLRRAVGATVSEVMEDTVVTCGEDDTLETAATLMHERKVGRIPVVRDGVLVGIIGQRDIIRAIVA